MITYRKSQPHFAVYLEESCLKEESQTDYNWIK